MASPTKDYGKRGVLRPYRSYNFREKDPVIDVLRTACEDAKARLTDLCADSGVSPTTYYNWWKGKTRRPQFATVAACARALGADAIEHVAGLLRKGRI